MKHRLRRREVLVGLGAGAAVVAAQGCGLVAPLCPDDGECRTTPTNGQGPYWRAGAPERTHLNVLDRPGTPLRVVGRVLDEDCTTPVTDARIDIWHADGEGRYDLDTDAFGMRGWQRTGVDGAWQLVTVQPGAYWFGGMARARHVHVIVEAPGYQRLVTQLFFADDPWIPRDAQYVCGSEVDARPDGDGLAGRFDFTLKRA